jgi:hypothetical protein
MRKNMSLLHPGYYLDLLFIPEDGGDMFFQKNLWKFTVIHSVTSQKTEPFGHVV